jgi:tRNA threonylcarbamoyl adenosine modification protein (Sua5/YciO/YrdC/YwlC family)
VSFDAAVGAIDRGDIVGLPTDTVYGLAIDPSNEIAVSRLYELKGRPAGRPIGLLAASLEQAATIGVIEGVAAQLAERFWPGALTLVVRPRVILPDWVSGEQARTVGIRVPDHETAMGFLGETGPLAVTSANLSGGPETYDDHGARAILGDRVAFYIEGSCPGGVASTVIDATGTDLVVLREGAIKLTG